MADDSDRSLTPDLQKRKRDAWACAYDRHADDVFAFVAHLLRGDKIAAEEIHQEAWLAALASIDAFDPARGELRAWIFGIARRQVALHYRRLGHARFETGTGSTADELAIDHDAILPDDVLSSIERGDAVRAALAELGEESRCALLGKYVEGQSVAELAGRLGRSPKAIESLLSRTRQRMRSLLRWYFDNETATKDTP